MAALTAFVAILAGCKSGLPVELPGISSPRVSDQEQIARLLDDVAKAMESRKIFKVLAHVSQNYEDAEGRNYDLIQSYLNEVFRDYRFIEITRARPRIVVRGDRATAIETFGTRATPFDDNQARPIDFDGQVIVHLVKQENGWKIVEWSAVS